MRRSIVLVALIGACVPAVSNAAWHPDGNPVVVAPAAQDRHAVIPFGSGGVLVAWVDQRGGDPGDIYAMALDAAGEPVAGWPSSGAPICTAAGEQAFLSVVPDGAGGAYLRWIDRRTGTPAHALQRITAGGQIGAGWPADGLVFGAGDIESAPYALASDGDGGAYVAWTEGGGARAARYSGAAEIVPGWPVDLPLTSASPYRFDMIADGAGGIVAAGSSGWQTTAIRLSSDGTLSPGWPPSGVVVSMWSLGPGLVAGQSDDFFVASVQPPPSCPCCYASTILVNRVGLDGDPAWPMDEENGGPLGEMIADDTGGILSVGASWIGCSSVAHGRAMRLGPDRSHPWGTGAPSICDQLYDQREPSIAADGSGGAFIGWIDRRDNGLPVLYATRFDALGDFASGWPSSGSMEALGAFDPSAPRVVATQPGTAVIVWVDRRNGTADLFAKEMVPGPAGPPAPASVESGPRSIAISSIAPNPSAGSARVQIDLRGSSPGRLAVLDLAGRVCEQRALPAGGTTVTLNGAATMRPGIYWLSVTQGGSVESRRFVVTR